ncbi:MAG: hypothetical protein ACKPE3_20600 [Sphaerospermopsis kisseleviana]
MNIEDIQDSVRIGVEVSVILRTGHQLSGFLSEIRETSIILRQASGAKMPLFAEAELLFIKLKLVYSKNGY